MVKNLFTRLGIALTAAAVFLPGCSPRVDTLFMYDPATGTRMQVQPKEKKVTKTRIVETFGSAPVEKAVAAKLPKKKIKNPKWKNGCKDCVPEYIWVIDQEAVAKQAQMAKAKGEFETAKQLTLLTRKTITDIETKEILGGDAVAGWFMRGQGATAPNAIGAAKKIVGSNDLEDLEIEVKTGPSDLSEIGGFIGNLGQAASGGGDLAIGLKWEQVKPNRETTTNITTGSQQSQDQSMQQSQQQQQQQQQTQQQAADAAAQAAANNKNLTNVENKNFTNVDNSRTSIQKIYNQHGQCIYNCN